jgi:hypothetical protein
MNVGQKKMEWAAVVIVELEKEMDGDVLNIEATTLSKVLGMGSKEEGVQDDS